MFSATRHAQRLAGNFLDDVDDFQRASRAADRRAMSHFENAVDPLVITTPTPMVPVAPAPVAYGRSPVRRMRYGSVPPVSPAAAAHYRSVQRLPFMVPHAPLFRHLKAHYVSDLTGSAPINSKEVYHSPYAQYPLPHHRQFYYKAPYNGGLPATVSSEILAERRRIDRKMDDLLSYKLPDVSFYNDLKASLRKVHDKMDTHRSMLDRYSGIDMRDNVVSVEDRINAKCQEVGERMGR